MTDRDKVDELPHDVTIRREAKIEIFYKHENNFYIMQIISDHKIIHKTLLLKEKSGFKIENFF